MAFYSGKVRQTGSESILNQKQTIKQSNNQNNPSKNESVYAKQNNREGACIGR